MKDRRTHDPRSDDKGDIPPSCTAEVIRGTSLLRNRCLGWRTGFPSGQVTQLFDRRAEPEAVPRRGVAAGALIGAVVQGRASPVGAAASQVRRRARADETGWRTNGRNGWLGWLWTVCDRRHTLYHVDDSRGGRVIRRLLGEAFGGTLVSDFYGAYDTIRCKQQKCVTHLLRELRDTARDSPAFAAGTFHPRCKRLLKDLLRLKRRWDELDDDAYTRRGCRLEDRLRRLAEAHAEDREPHARRLALRVQRYQKQPTAFRWERRLDGTNNAAERALRPAVVMRKITGGSRSRSPAGAQAWAVTASILRTARQQGQGRDVLETPQAATDGLLGRQSSTPAHVVLIAWR